MTWGTVVWGIARRLIILVSLPYGAFWALATFVPFYVIPYTLRTILSFWILVWAAQWLWHTIRHDDWSDINIISREP